MKLEIEQKKPAPSDFGDKLSSERAFVEAELNGWKVVLPKPNELLIDIDSNAQLDIFWKNYPRIIRYIGVIDNIIKPSKSGEEGCKHITLVLEREVTPTERILLQAVLGSDLTREILSFCRILEDDPNPTLFLEKDDAPKQLPAATEILSDKDTPF